MNLRISVYPAASQNDNHWCNVGYRDLATLLRHAPRKGYPVRRSVTADHRGPRILVWAWSRAWLLDHGHLLVRRRTTSPRPDLETAGRVGGARVKGGRRPSRSDVALDDREPRGRLEGRVSFLVLGDIETTSEASSPWTRYRVADLYSVDPSGPKP